MKFSQVRLPLADMGGNKIENVTLTVPIKAIEDTSDFRFIDEIINEGDEDGLKFESYSFGSSQKVPFTNVNQNFKYNGLR